MKKLFAIILALILALSLCACNAKPAETTAAATEALKSFTVTVIHADETEKVFTYETGEKILGDFLEAEGLIESEGADDGMFHTVDGEKADWNENQSYWSLYIGEEYAMTGIYATDITDGGSYKLVYTLG
ncbi:MAG: hypothetical protein IKJ94_05610 [Oscillospiraceae bacterium]|nr:hypothetical protein [Oscillospiraceae bacterium]